MNENLGVPGSDDGWAGSREAWWLGLGAGGDRKRDAPRNDLRVPHLHHDLRISFLS